MRRSCLAFLALCAVLGFAVTGTRGASQAIQPSRMQHLEANAAVQFAANFDLDDDLTDDGDDVGAAPAFGAIPERATTHCLQASREISTAPSLALDRRHETLVGTVVLVI